MAAKIFRRHELGKTYQGFTKALAAWQQQLREVILPRFWQLIQESGKAFWEVAGWVVFAADGSRVDTPRTKANARRFQPGKKRKPKPRNRKGRTPRVTRAARRAVRRRSKAARNYPRKKNERPAGKPLLLHATPEQIRQANELKARQQANRLTA